MRRVKAAASGVNEDVMAERSNPSLQGAAPSAQSEVAGSGIARGVKGFKGLAGVMDDIGALFVRAHAF